MTARYFDITTIATSLVRWTLPALLLVVACGVYRATRAASSVDTLVELRAAAHPVLPRYDLPMVATDGQLHEVLTRMRPPAGRIVTNELVHALRLWGPRVEFDDPQVLDGSTMLAYFLDDKTFRRLAGNDTPPLFVEGPHGINARPWQENSPHRSTAAVHVDDLLATLAESGVPLDMPLTMRDRNATVGDLLRGAMRRYHYDQHEYEWTAISYARYLFPTRDWHNDFGQPIDVDVLVNELLEQPLPNGICGGTHRLEALAVLARIDESENALSRRTRKRIVQHLSGVAARLVAAQHYAGYWSRLWTQGEPPRLGKEGSLYEHILLTGHHLEWLALAPPEVQPPRESIVRAGQWLVRAMLEADAEDLQDHYGPFTHAARALCLWRGREADQVWTEAAADAAE